MRCVKVELAEDYKGESYIQEIDKLDLLGELDGAEVGTVLRLTIIEMTQEELDSLPEFMGW